MAISVFIVGSKTMPARFSVSPGKKALFRFAGGCSSGEEAIRMLGRRRIDLVLVNFDLPCMDGSECVRKLRKLLPETPILMFLTTERTHDDDLIFAALHAGANGFLPAQLPSAEITRAAFQVHQGANHRCPVFVMLYESDRHLARSAKYWHKVIGLLNTSTVSIDYGKQWRRVFLRMETALAPMELLVPPLVLVRRASMAA